MTAISANLRLVVNPRDFPPGREKRKYQRKSNQRRRPAQKAKKRAAKLVNTPNAANSQINQTFAGPTTAATQTVAAMDANEYDESRQSSISEVDASDSEMAEESEEEDADSDEARSASGAADPEEEARLLREYIQRRNPGLVAERERQLRQMRENRQIRNELLDLEDRGSGTDEPTRVRGEDAFYTGRQNSVSVMNAPCGHNADLFGQMSRVASSPMRERKIPLPPYMTLPSTIAEPTNATAEEGPRPARSLPSFRRAQPATGEKIGQAYVEWIRDNGIRNPVSEKERKVVDTVTL